MVAVTLRLVFLITPDPGGAEEEKLLSDVSIMTRLCTEVYIHTACRRQEEGARGGRASRRWPGGSSRPGSRVETVRRDKKSAI